MRRQILAVTVVVLSVQMGHAQTAIHDATILPANQDPHSSAVLDVKSTNKGLLVPRVALTIGSGDAAPLSSPENSLLIFNTANVGDVTPGYYYWNSGSWVRLVASNAPLAGDVTGLMDANSVVRIQGRDVDAAAPTNGQVLKWVDASSSWVPSADANTTYSAMSVAEGIAGTATSSRVMRADRLQPIIEHWAPPVTLTGENYLSLSGQQITANPVDLASTNVTGVLPIANGGTGSSSQNWVDLTTNQTAAGNKTWSGVATFSNVTPVRASNGTAALPAYSFTSDPNIGLYRIGADVLGLSTAGVERMRIGATGNVKIATQSTTIAGGNINNGWLTIGDNASSGVGIDNNEIYFQGIEGNFGVLSNHNLNISTNGSARIVVQSNGVIRLPAYTTNGIVRTTAGNGTLSSTGGGINLTSEVTGVLPIANGGTGSSTQGWVDLTTDQTATGVKTWSDQANFGNVLRASNGSAAAPAYSFTNSTNMGMYRAGSTDLRLITGGDWRIQITNDFIRARTRIRNGNGTAGLPAYTFADNTGTGMWRAGTDILAFSTAGVERLRVLANGNVGIGAISTPATLLHMGSLSDATTASQILTVESMGFSGLHLTGDRGGTTGEPGGAFVRLSQDALGVNGIFGVVNVAGQDGSGAALSGTEGNSVVLGNKYSGTLHLATNNAVRMSIASNGTARLHTYTSNGLLKTTSGNGTIAIATGADLPAGSGSYIQNQTASAQSANFYISGYGRANDFRASNGTAAAPTYRFASDTDIGMYRATTNTLAFSTAAVERMRIASNGNVGIGTTGPAHKLHVADLASGGGILIGQYNERFGWTGSTSNIPFMGLRFAGYRDVVSNFTGAMVAGERINICCSGLSQGMELGFWVQPNTATVSGDGNLLQRAVVFGSGMAAWDYYYLSDRRIKEDIRPMSYGLNEVMQIEPVSYSQKVTKGLRESHGHVEGDSEESFGFIAQELQKILPELVNVPEDSDKYWTVSYGKLTPILVKAIQEQQQLIEELQSRIESLEAGR